MSDFERRVEEALASGAEGAPDASGLAEGARRRSRRRRRTTGAVAAAAVVAAVAVPVGVIALNDGGSESGEVAEDPSPPSDTRIETWHDIQVEVPASWGYGARTAWCPAGEADKPVVERPGGVVAMIACDPTNSFGVSWVDGSTTAIDPVYPSGEVWQYEAGDIKEYEPGSWLGYWYDGDDMVQVNAADKETVQEILDSVQRVDGVDGNGCPVIDDGAAGDVADDEVSVCRYSADGDLEQSELLVGDDAEAARAAVEDAPRPGGAHNCANDPGEYVVMTVGSERAEVQYAGMSCSDRGLFVGDEVRELTNDVMYWALSPGWFGSVEGWVPLPDKLRGLETIERERDPQETSPCLEAIGPVDDEVTLLAEGPAALCRYDLSWEGESGGTFLLEDERELSADDEARLVAAIEAAPASPGPSSGTCRGGAGGKGELFVLHSPEGTFFVYNTQCALSGVDVHGGSGPAGHELTPELLDALGSPYGLLR